MKKLPSVSQSSQKTLIALRLYLILFILGGIFALAALLRIPVDVKNVAVFGFSKERLIIFMGGALVMLGAFSFLLLSWIKKSIFTVFQEKLTKKVQQKTTWGWIVIFSVLALFWGSYIILLTPEITEPFTKAYFERILPLVIWFMMLSGQTLLVLSLIHYDFNLRQLKPKSRIVYLVVMTFGALLILWFLIALTGLGVTASDAGAGWNYLASPVIEMQAFLAWGVGMVYIILFLWLEKHPEFLNRVSKHKFLQSDLVFSILIWLVAFLIWNGTPLLESWFATSPQPPNQAFYPNSDASTYDTIGQSLLVGVGFKVNNAPFAIRPMYALFLAILHSIGGLDYEPIIWMQVAVLACIPVLLYWITRQLHNRVSALIAASLLISRETNAIALGDTITTSHVKLLMSDLPTVFGVMLFILLVIFWLQNPAQRQTLTLIAGGVTGAFILVRPEFFILVPFVGLAALLQMIHQTKVWFKGMLLIALGATLMLAPWIWRNYQITGTIFLDSPHYRANLLALRYSETEDRLPLVTPQPGDSSLGPDTPGGEVDLANQPTATPGAVLLPGETREEFAQRMVEDAGTFARNNPGSVLSFVSNHFLNSQIQTVLYLPGTIRLPDSAISFIGHKDLSRFWKDCCSAEGYIRRLPYWFKWDGDLPQQSVVPIMLNLFVISIGFASSWKKNKFLGLIPVAASLGYTLINAVVRNSGGRYILAIDWVGMLYYAIGLGQLTLWVIAYFRKDALPPNLIREIQDPPPNGDQSLWRKANLWAAIGILLIGILLPLSEKIISPRYSTDPHQIQSKFQALPDDHHLRLETFLESGGDVFLGRALYPRFYPTGYETSTIDAGDLPANGHTAFRIVGPFNGKVFLFRDTAPTEFPNGSDVLLIGCRGKKYFDALAVAVYDSQGNLIEFIQREPWPDIYACPLPAP